MTEAPKQFRVSPTKLETHKGCPRKRWFLYDVEMPIIQDQEQFTYGNQLHDVCERFMQADDNGRVPAPPKGDVWLEGSLKGQRAGTAVDIYPKGWDRGLRPIEKLQIKKTVQKAIEGPVPVLVRMPGRRVEKGYKREVIPGVIMSGRMDVEHPEGVDDHKSTSARKWKLSAKKLARDPKMLCYAHEFLVRREEAGEEVPDKVTLRLNYFGKDPDDPFTTFVDVDVASDYAEKFWEDEVVPACQEMLDLHNAEIPEDRWSEVQGAIEDGICRKYGGCDFAPICGHQRSAKKHRRVMERANGKTEEPKPKKNPKGKTMQLFNSAKNRKGGAPAKPAAAKPAVAKPAKPEAATAVAEPEAPVAQDANIPPWANKHCLACGGSGISSKGGACDPCLKIAQRTKRYDPSQWEVGETDGVMTWAPKDGVEGEAGQASSGPEAEAVAPKRAVRAKVEKEPEPEPAPEPAPAPEPDVEQILEEFAAEVTAEAIEELPPSAEQELASLEAAEGGFILLCGAAVSKPGVAPIVDLSALIAVEGAEMLADLKAKAAEGLGPLANVDKDELAATDSYFQLNAFMRRDMMASCAKEIAEEQLGGTIVVASGSSPDMIAFRDALRPYADLVIEGVS